MHSLNVLDFTTNSEPLDCRFRCHSLKDSIDVFLWPLAGWFDHGWIYSVPPPNVPINDTRSYGKNPGDWEGLSSEVWGSHLYYDTMRRFNSSSSRRPLALSRNGGGNWRAGMSSESVAGVAAHHRYPVCESCPDRSTATAVLLKLGIRTALHAFKNLMVGLPCLAQAELPDVLICQGGTGMACRSMAQSAAWSTRLCTIFALSYTQIAALEKPQGRLS